MNDCPSSLNGKHFWQNRGVVEENGGVALEEVACGLCGTSYLRVHRLPEGTDEIRDAYYGDTGIRAARFVAEDFEDDVNPDDQADGAK